MSITQAVKDACDRIDEACAEIDELMRSLPEELRSGYALPVGGIRCIVGEARRVADGVAPDIDEA